MASHNERGLHSSVLSRRPIPQRDRRLSGEAKFNATVGCVLAFSAFDGLSVRSRAVTAYRGQLQAESAASQAVIEPTDRIVPISTAFAAVPTARP